MLQALFPHLKTQLYNPGHGSFATESLYHTNICVMKGISYQNVFCYVDFLGEGNDGNSLDSETI